VHHTNLIMAPNGETERHITPDTNSIDSKVLPNDRLNLFINGQWYDLTQWQNLHPGGTEILQHLNGKDATDAFYAIHSDDAIKRLSRMKPCSSLQLQSILPTIEPTKQTLSFRQLRIKLIKDGYFNRSIGWELFYLFSVYFLCLLGTFCHFYWGHHLLAIIAIGFGMQQAGWIGHDYAHGRGTSMRWLSRKLTGLINAFSPTWWSHKHNTHHVYTNNIGIDTDIANDPVFHLFFPSKDKDVWFRAYQHWYYIPVYSLLYLSWRWQSLQHALNTSKYFELTLMLINYIWLYTLGWQVALGSTLLGGLLVAIIVTATHQSEEMLVDSNYPFVETQFLTTCDASCDNFFMEWLWGGMQYQLEHHLFPTMPKYKYAQVRPIIQKWAKDNGIDYRCQSVWTIWRRNYLTMKHFASPVGNSRDAA
jgi:fatty acid desaturase